jgi:hypothetical protein
VTQLTAYFNPSQTANPRTRGSVRRASGFVQIAIALFDFGRKSGPILDERKRLGQLAASSRSRSGSLALTQVLNRFAENTLPLRPFCFGGINHRLSFVVSNGEVSAMFNEQRNGTIINCSNVNTQLALSEKIAPEECEWKGGDSSNLAGRKTLSNEKTKEPA